MAVRKQIELKNLIFNFTICNRLVFGNFRSATTTGKQHETIKLHFVCFIHKMTLEEYNTWKEKPLICSTLHECKELKHVLAQWKPREKFLL